MLPDRSIPRPTYAQVFADVALKDVSTWMAGHPTLATFREDLPDILVSVAATAERRDAFAYCEALKTKLDWPVDELLVSTFSALIKLVERKELRSAEMAWVMKSGFRWKAPVGSTVSIMDKTARYYRDAKVVSIDAVTATATMEFVLGDKRVLKAYVEDLPTALVA